MSDIWQLFSWTYQHKLKTLHWVIIVYKRQFKTMSSSLNAIFCFLCIFDLFLRRFHSLNHHNWIAIRSMPYYDVAPQFDNNFHNNPEYVKWIFVYLQSLFQLIILLKNIFFKRFFVLKNQFKKSNFDYLLLTTHPICAYVFLNQIYLKIHRQ